TTQPASARVMIVSSLSKDLPVVTGIPASSEFNAIWDTPDGAKPSTLTWTSWSGSGDDLRIKKLNLQPQFYQLILINHDTTRVGRYSIDSNPANGLGVTAGGAGTNSFFLDGSVVGLHDENN